MCSIRTFVPLLQAAVSSECTASYIRIFKEATSLWNSKAAPSCQLPGNLVQLHRDFHAGSEAARKAVFPTARPMDDYAHLVRNLQKHLARTAFKGRASDPTGDKSASLCSCAFFALCNVCPQSCGSLPFPTAATSGERPWMQITWNRRTPH